MPGVLDFDATALGLVRAKIRTPSAEATLYLQGAHLTDWQPVGQGPVLFTSGSSDFVSGKAIRGGIPVIFPWFANREGASGPAHGFARTQEWKLAFAAIAGDDLHLTLTLGPTEMSRSLGYDRFRLAYTVSIGRRLGLQLAVANDSESPLNFEEALHSYFAVEDVREASIAGLEGTVYLDKVDGMRRKQQTDALIRFTGRRDEVHVNTASTCVLRDEAGGRSIRIEKSGSESTVVWNPWEELAATLPDMEPGGWQRMVCIETANIGENRITLAAGESHAMRVAMSVEALKS